MNTLVLKLPLTLDNNPTVYDFVQLNQDDIDSPVQSETLAHIAATLGNHAIVAMIPITQLAWHEIKLPAGSLSKRITQSANAHFKSILVGLLEEALLDEPDNIHFAIAPNASVETPTKVATCNASWLAQHINAFKQHGLTLDRIVPELSPVDEPSESLTLYMQGNECFPMLFAQDTSGICVRPAQPSYVQHVEHTQTSFALMVEPHLAQQAEALFSQEITLQTTRARWYEAAKSAWSIDQFEFSLAPNKGVSTKTKEGLKALCVAPQWKWTRWFIVSAIIINVIGLNLWAYQEKTKISKLKTDIKNIFKTTFPHVKVIVDAPLQMTKELKVLSARNQTLVPQDIETMLSVLSQSLPSSIHPTAVDFTGSHLNIKGSVLSQDELQKLQNKLTPMGYTLKNEGPGQLTMTLTAKD